MKDRLRFELLSNITLQNFTNVLPNKNSLFICNINTDEANIFNELQNSDKEIFGIFVKTNDEEKKEYILIINNPQKFYKYFQDEYINKKSSNNMVSSKLLFSVSTAIAPQIKTNNNIPLGNPLKNIDNLPQCNNNDNEADVEESGESFRVPDLYPFSNENELSLSKDTSFASEINWNVQHIQSLSDPRYFSSTNAASVNSETQFCSLNYQYYIPQYQQVPVLQYIEMFPNHISAPHNFGYQTQNYNDFGPVEISNYQIPIHDQTRQSELSNTCTANTQVCIDQNAANDLTVVETLEVDKREKFRRKRKGFSEKPICMETFWKKYNERLADAKTVIERKSLEDTKNKKCVIKKLPQKKFRKAKPIMAVVEPVNLNIENKQIIEFLKSKIEEKEYSKRENPDLYLLYLSQDEALWLKKQLNNDLKIELGIQGNIRCKGINEYRAQICVTTFNQYIQNQNNQIQTSAITTENTVEPNLEPPAVQAAISELNFDQNKILAYETEFNPFANDPELSSFGGSLIYSFHDGVDSQNHDALENNKFENNQDDHEQHSFG